MTPVVITNKITGEIVFTGGASGGTRITTVWGSAKTETEVLSQELQISNPSIRNCLSDNFSTDARLYFE